MKALWRGFWRPSTKWGVLVIFIVGAIIGMVALFGGHAALQYSESTEFCTSCHEMRDNVYAEYIETPHFSNASGVQAGCADCHVPKPFIPMVIDHYQALGELYHWAIGTIDTPEKFESHRLELAQSVWDDMLASDSRECRACHVAERIDYSVMEPAGAKEMQDGLAKGDTCISCHKGIAHTMPASALAAPTDGTAPVAGAVILE
ncbi:MAG: NapC/NirT family cytochrome c [Pseudorhodobacter sp.]|nr:NapC/NirT family cytochrome c [Pseudorhodobacter sp.]